MNPLLRSADLLRARQPDFERLVDQTLLVIRTAARSGRIGISFSGGKDSTVLLHLVRQIAEEAPAAFFDSGCELQSTRRFVRSIGATVIHPRFTFVEMARYAGWWGYCNPVDRDCPFDVKTVLVEEPSESFVVRQRLRIIAIGLRAEESHARRMLLRTKGKIYQGVDRTWYLNPLADWKTNDVWAYIASRGLEYNVAYDRMEQLGLSRRNQRVSPLLDAGPSAYGSIVTLRRIEPETFAGLAREFPRLREVS